MSPASCARRSRRSSSTSPSTRFPTSAGPIDEWDREPFGLLRFLRPHRWRLLGAIGLVLIETIALQLGPILTQIAIDEGVREQDRA